MSGGVSSCWRKETPLSTCLHELTLSWDTGLWRRSSLHAKCLLSACSSSSPCFPDPNMIQIPALTHTSSHVALHVRAGFSLKTFCWEAGQPLNGTQRTLCKSSKGSQTLSLVFPNSDAMLNPATSSTSSSMCWDLPSLGCCSCARSVPTKMRLETMSAWFPVHQSHLHRTCWCSGKKGRWQMLAVLE